MVPKGEKLLVQNKIERDEIKGIDLSDEKDNLKQEPNRELLGFIKFHLWAYQYGNKGLGIRKKQPWHRRLAEKVGEPPVLIDSAKMLQSAQRLSEYYFSKGFLENEINYSVSTKKLFGLVPLKKRSVVTYNVDIKNFHSIKSIEYNATSRELDRLVKKYDSEKLLAVDKRLDFEDIEDERNRLTNLFRNNGFYYFNATYIDFQVDTNRYKYLADVVVSVRNRSTFEPHYQQSIDSILVVIGDGDKAVFPEDGIMFYESDYLIKPKALAKNIVFRPGELYNASKIQKTYSNLLSTTLFNFVTVRFRPSSKDSNHLLIAEIELKTAPKHDFIWEPQGIYTEQSSGVEAGQERNLGIANSFTLRNRNVFGGAESFNINSFTALEAQLQNDDNRTFNSFRQTVNAELNFPQLLYFERKDFSTQLTRKSTKFKVSFLHDQNVNFTRNVFPFSFSYNFTNKDVSYALTPFRISVNQAIVESSFLASLDPETRAYTSQLLTNNLIVGPTASLFWTNKKYSRDAYWSIRSNALELSGNLLSLYFSTFTNNTGINKEVLGVKYSQYTRSDIDATFTKIIDENNSWATRFYAGFGLPYGNTRFLPFERRFFVGGGSGLRAWRPRTVGPGSFTDASNTISIEKTGEMILQASAEYRFDIVDRYVDGALFLDAGNIWNFREDANRENAEFRFDRFYKEIAMNTGLGLRFDLTYIIFRIDWGIALHDPTFPENNRWVIQDFFSNDWIKDNTAVNFAVGYPF